MGPSERSNRAVAVAAAMARAVIAAELVREGAGLPDWACNRERPLVPSQGTKGSRPIDRPRSSQGRSETTAT